MESGPTRRPPSIQLLDSLHEPVMGATHFVLRVRVFLRAGIRVSRGCRQQLLDSRQGLPGLRKIEPYRPSGVVPGALEVACCRKSNASRRRAVCSGSRSRTNAMAAWAAAGSSGSIAIARS